MGNAFRKTAFVLALVVVTSSVGFGTAYGYGAGGGGPSCAPGTAYNPSTSSCTPIGGQVLGASTGPGVGCAPGDKFNITTGQACPVGLTFVFNMNLHQGMSGPDVVQLQQFLIAHGYSIPFGVTGYFGSQTFAAVKAFQSAHGISPTGYVGSLTRAALNATS